MIFANRIIISQSTQRRTIHPPANIPNRPSTFYDKTLYQEFEEHYPFDDIHKSQSSSVTTNTFYQKNVSQEFRVQGSSNGVKNRIKKRLFK